MEFAPWTSFARNMHRYGSNTGVRTLSCAEQFRAMTYAQLTREALLLEHCERRYPPTVKLPMFICQLLKADGSCRKAVNRWATQSSSDGLGEYSVRTGGNPRYCRARQQTQWRAS